MRNPRRYTCIMRHGGGFGGGLRRYLREGTQLLLEPQGREQGQRGGRHYHMAQAARLHRMVRGRAGNCENRRGGLAMERREPKQWAEILKILKEAREDLETVIEAERPIAEGITYRR